MMDADARRTKQLFDGSDRYLVPAYQRAYVWEQDRQWQPLWEDIERLADARLDDREELHFLGAIVLRQEKSAPGGLTEWSVIDGQQRLTTLQIMLSAIAAAAAGDGVEPEARRLRKMTLHDEDDAEGDERLRFWPTTVNQDAYRAVMHPDGLADDRVDDPGNTIEEAWVFFLERARDYASREDEQSGIDATNTQANLVERYGALREAIAGMIQVVAIQLEPGDPSQVIFETLNARGTPLLATDLVKNALFERAQASGADIDEIQRTVWMTGLGDDEYWSADERLGRLTVPRSQAFLMHWLAMQLGEVVAADSLFDTFRRSFLDGPDAPDPVALTKELNEDANLLRSFDEEIAKGSPAGRFIQTTRVLDTTVFHPLVLVLLRKELSAEEQARVFGALSSFLVRRMVCRLTTKNYNRLVSDLIAATSGAAGEAVADRLIEGLLESQAETARWPTDDEFIEALTLLPLYGYIARGRVAFLLSALEIGARRENRAEELDSLPSNLQVEHVMPQSWQRNWPLPEDASPEQIASREDHINLLGNLTLTSGPLNAQLSNGPWSEKRKALKTKSLFALNQDLAENNEWDHWDEEAIDLRGERLATKLCEIWTGAQAFVPDSWAGPSAEMSPELADMTASEIQEVFDEAKPYMRELLVDLSEHPDERRTYAEIEESLDWPSRRLPGVLGGFRSSNRQLDGKRPFRIHLDGDGVWWMWTDAEAASAIQERLREENESVAATAEQVREQIQSDEVRALVDGIPELAAAYPGMTVRMFGGSRSNQVSIAGPNGRGTSGYFAQEWLLLWWRGRFDGDHAWFTARLSDPDQVTVNKNGTLRFHVRNEADMKVVLEALAGG